MTILDRVRLWRAARQAEQQILRELSTYTDRELAELNLSRGDVADIAREGYRQVMAEAGREHEGRRVAIGGTRWEGFPA